MGRALPGLDRVVGLATREEVWKDLFEQRLDASRPVVVLEFGVYRGESLRAFAALHGHADSRFFGFDSFEGLPEDWAFHWKRGAFDQGGHAPLVSDERISFVKGWFNQTLGPFLRACSEWFDPRFQRVVHFDADLYSSTLFVLAQLWGTGQPYHFVFDEFTGEECVALHDYLTSHGDQCEFFSSRNNVLGTPTCLSGRVLRTGGA